ncbi:MAG: hypothetical protein RLZZ200_1242 [Pseudomonadota bacterium]|jgi:tetratricopeptide (TPR) repeat protein
MTKHSFHAVILAVAVATGGVSIPTVATAAGAAMSAAVAVPLDAANKAIKANRLDEALAKLREAGAVSGKTPQETHVMNQLLSFVLLKQNKFAEALPVLEQMLGSGQVSAAERTTINKQLLGIYSSQKNYPKMLEIGQGLISAGAADNATFGAVATAYEKTGKLGDAVKFVKTRIDSATSAGKKPPENELLLLLDYQRRLKDEKGAADTFEKLVTYYQKADYWENVLQPVLKAPGNTDAATLNVYRLMRSTGALKRATDYTEMAQLSTESGASGEALEVLQKAISSNAFTEARDKDRTSRLLESIKKKVAAEQAGVAKADADAAAGKSGDADVAVARTYFGLGQYDKAAAAAKRGIAKGGLTSVEEAQTLLGIALLRQKKNGEAVAAFRAVKGDPKFANMASYWAIHAR